MVIQDKIIRIYCSLHSSSSANMLATRIFGRCIRSQFLIPIQQLHVSRSLSSYKKSSGSDSNSSTSSESSDSDSDVNTKKQQVDNTIQNDIKANSTTEEQLYNILENMMNKPAKKPIDTIKPTKQKREKPKDLLRYEEKLEAAAEEVANTIGEDNNEKKDIKSTLLYKLSSVQENKSDFQAKPATSINDVISGMAIEKTEKPSVYKHIPENRNRVVPRYNVSKDPKLERFTAPVYSKRTQVTDILYDTNKELRIFKHIDEYQETDAPKLSTWDALEEKLIQLTVSPTPSNAFQELIKWTNEGKLWKFPIDNEQDLGKEHDVHFSEHVFMERHLVGWCPEKGPLRHFMELVCVGLSKNPYMTVEEKVEHIMWYKQYFSDKEKLLREIGVIDSNNKRNEQPQLE